MATPPIELVSLLQLCDCLIDRKKSISNDIKPTMHTNHFMLEWEVVNVPKAYVSFEATPQSMATIPAIVDLVHIINNVLVSKGATKGSIELITYTNTNKFTYGFKLAGLSFFLAAIFDWADPNNITKKITLHRGYSTGIEIDGVNVAHSLYSAVRTMLVKEDARLSKDVSTKMKRKFEILDILCKI